MDNKHPNNNKTPEFRPRSSKKGWFVLIAVIVIVVLLAVLLSTSGNKAEVLSYDALTKKINAGEVSGIYFTGDYAVNVLYKTTTDEEKIASFKKGDYKDATCIVTNRNALVLALENYQRDAIDSGKPYDMPTIWLNDPNARSFTSYIFPALSLLLLAGIAIFFFISMRGKGGAGGVANFGKSKARITAHTKVKFDDVAGAEEEKEELKEIVDFLKNPKKFRDVGAKVPRGVLLVGSPGTGKTLFAKAVAGEANVPFYSISGSDFVEMYVGVGASRVRDLFAQAKKTQPCIVFIDEIDAVGRKRGAGLGGGNDEREQTLNQLLVQMDGFEETDGIVIMAATNRVDVLDPALLRPGRFDRQIYVHIPDVKGREAIFKVHAKNKPMSPDIDFKNLARLTSGFSGADIANLLNESAILAARDNRKVILMKDILEGINKVIAGPQKKSRIITEKDKRITAYHEAGHALVGRLMKYCDAVQEVSIIPRGWAAGYTISRPKSDDSHVTKNHLNDVIAMTLGGRAAEEIVIQDISTGASMDIKQATSTARKMVTEWGMSPSLPNTYFGGEQEVFIGRDYQTQASYSDEIAAIIDKEIRKIIDDNYARARKTLEDNIGALHAMVKLLFEHETIYGDEIDLLIEGKSVEEVNEYIAKKRAEQARIAKEKEDAVRAKTNPLGNPKDFIVKEEKPQTPAVIVLPEKLEEKPENKNEANVEKPIETDTEKQETAPENKETNDDIDGEK